MRISLLTLTLFLSTAALAQSVDDAALLHLKVTSGRSTAWAQFNMPAVRLWLPHTANSAYATEEFDAPKVVDAKGTPVAHEVEQGLYDHDKWENEIRIGTKGAPARMSGTIHLQLPPCASGPRRPATQRTSSPSPPRSSSCRKSSSNSGRTSTSPTTSPSSPNTPTPRTASPSPSQPRHRHARRQVVVSIKK